MDGAAKLQAWYGSSIVSFLGAPHWGLAMASAAAGTGSVSANVVRYAWGVTPSRFAFPVPALPEAPALRILASSLGAVRGTPAARDEARVSAMRRGE